MKRTGKIAAAALLAVSCVKAPESYGPVPSAAQLEWHKREMIMFCHFGQATFSGYDGDCRDTDWSEAILLENYRPREIDADQWVKTAADNGFREVILTAKHHDGFCLWDNPESTADIANPACRNHMDVVQAVRDACSRYGVEMGIYLSPWDRMIEAAGVPQDRYEIMYKNALRDLLTRYAPVAEMWFDGHNAGKFNWEEVNRTVLEINPDCVIFSDGGPGCRWVGNEEGTAGETNWNTVNVKGRGLYPGHAPGNYMEYLGGGDKGGDSWCPAECDFSIQAIGDRNGWFYGADDARKSASDLMEIYYRTVGRGGVFLMNVPPSDKGIIDDRDRETIEAFTAMRERVFGTDLADGAVASSRDARSKKYGPQNLLDGNYDTCFAARDGETSADVEIVLDGTKTFNLVMLQEYIPLGQRVEAFTVEVRENGTWKEWGSGSTIGYKRILKGPTFTADAVRLRVTCALACPVLNGFGLYLD